MTAGQWLQLDDRIEWGARRRHGWLASGRGPAHYSAGSDRRRASGGLVLRFSVAAGMYVARRQVGRVGRVGLPTDLTYLTHQTQGHFSATAFRLARPVSKSLPIIVSILMKTPITLPM